MSEFYTNPDFNNRVPSAGPDLSGRVPSAGQVPSAGPDPSGRVPMGQTMTDIDKCDNRESDNSENKLDNELGNEVDEDEIDENEPEDEVVEDDVDMTDEPNQIEQLLNNPVLNSIELPENFVSYMEQQVDNLINNTINKACNNMYDINQNVLSYIEKVYLNNMSYHDQDIITLIKYTIRMALNINSDFELDEICAGIMYMGLTGSNVVFETNYETCIQIIRNELKMIYNRSYIQAFLQSIMNPNMEDVKKVLSEEELEKLPVSTFKELDSSITNINTKCTVCQEEFCPNDKVRCLPCKHVYHQECVDGWLTSHSHKCPCCRTEAGVYVFKE